MPMATIMATIEPAAVAMPAGTEAMKIPTRMMAPLTALPRR